MMDRTKRLKTEAGAMGIYSGSFMRRKCIEPIKRRHGSPQPEWQAHRFEIKGGISWRDAMIYDMANQRNPFLDMIKVVE